MSEPVKVKVDGADYKVHDDGDVFKVVSGIISDSTLKVGRIPASTPQNKLEEVIRELINR